ncbi:MAG: ABC transporter permease subunit [Acidobacteria bacterium]|nr:ABC transporter permease subunit [Acidobacteriota bacterium]
MRNIGTLWKKELNMFFVSPIAYVVLTIFLLLAGFFFNSIVVRVVEFSIQEMIQAQQFGGPPPERDLTQDIFRAFFGVLSTVILFLMPMLTMGVFAEEKRRGTMELLMTSPVTHWQIILGKFLASVTFFALMLIPTLIHGLFVYLYSEPRLIWKPVLSGYLGIFLLGTVLISMGIFISSLTENQIIAAVITFTLFIILWVIDFAAQGTGLVSEILRYMSVLTHYEDFSKGVIDTKSLIFYGSLILLGLFLTSSSIESMRWRE